MYQPWLLSPQGWLPHPRGGPAKHIPWRNGANNLHSVPPRTNPNMKVWLFNPLDRGKELLVSQAAVSLPFSTTMRIFKIWGLRWASSKRHEPNFCPCLLGRPKWYRLAAWVSVCKLFNCLFIYLLFLGWDSRWMDRKRTMQSDSKRHPISSTRITESKTMQTKSV